MTVLGSFMIICSSVMAFRLFFVKDLLGFSYEIFIISFVPKVWYLVFWFSEEETELSENIPRLLFAWLAILFEMLIPLYFPIAMIYRFDKLQSKVTDIKSKTQFLEIWKVVVLQQAIIKVSDLQFCSENTQYLVDYDKLESLKDQKEIEFTLKVLYKRYLDSGAIMELNLPGELVKTARIHYKANTLQLSTFSIIQSKVIDMLMENTIPMVDLSTS